MLLEARTLSDLEAAKLRLLGWVQVKQEGSETLLRWPRSDRWPPDPEGITRATQ